MSTYYRECLLCCDVFYDLTAAIGIFGLFFLPSPFRIAFDGRKSAFRHRNPCWWLNSDLVHQTGVATEE